VCALAAGGLIPTDFLLDGPAWAWPALGALPATLYVGVLAFAGNLAASGTDDTARAQALIVHCPDAIARQRRNGNLTFVSPAAGELVEADTSDLLGDGLFRRIHVSDRPAYLKALDDAAEGSAAMAAFRLRRGDGAEADWLWIEMRCRAATQHCGSDSGDLVTVLRDISARKATEQDMTAAFEEMERSSLAKSRFLARVSHELRTPLNAIIGFSEILSQEMFGKLEQDRNREYAELIHDSGRHLLELINDILDMSRIESGHFRIVAEPFDLSALIENCCQLLKPQADAAGLRIETDLPVSLPELVADRRACKQMLLNLLHNAVKFSNHGGRVVVGAYVDGGTTSVYVADEGVGISREDIKLLGQPFVQLQSSYDRNYEGAGLGLSVVKGLVTLHGGEMEIESEPGVGTRLTLRFPAAVAPEETGKPGTPDDPARMTA
jgi:two-component system, cell cycle sensor histidine kinase DivJ